jgi:ABC-type dipeptide/oligopeptide/nickel transport system ATPase subunit
MTDSMGSSRSRQENRRSPIQFVFSDHELSLHASHLLSTKLGEQCRKEYEKNLLQDERMVHAVRLAASSADLNIVGETGLYRLLGLVEKS